MILILKNVTKVKYGMKKKYFGISIDETALGKNDGCAKASEFLLDLFKVKGEQFLVEGEIEEKHEQIYKQSKEMFEKTPVGIVPVIFGGTHDITGFTFKAFSEKYEDAKLLIFDAHADCEDALSITTHEDFVRMVVENNIVEPKNLMIVGLRHLSGIEKDFLKEKKIKHFYFEELNEAFHVFTKIVEAFAKSGKMYVSFDVDVIDSKLMKATGHFPNEGLSKEQTEIFLEIALPYARAIDLVEFNPDKIALNEDKLLFDLFTKYFK
jgi:arginase family enzyme